MKHCMLLLVLTIVVTGLVAEGEFLWQEGGKPLVTSADIRWMGTSVRTPDDGYFITWTESGAVNHDLFGMRLDADCQMLWDEPRLLIDDASPLYDDKIVISSDGYIYLSWFTYYTGLMQVNKFDLEGNQLWATPYQMDCDTGYVGEWLNREMIPDLDGGVYVFDESGYAMRLSGSGDELWEQWLALYDGYRGYTEIDVVLDDGEGGFIVGNEAVDCMLLQRILPDGSTAWFLEMPEGDIHRLSHAGDGEFAFLNTEHTAALEDNVNLYKFNIAGELLTDEPILLLGDCNVSLFNITGDSDGSLCTSIAYTDYRQGICGMQIDRITPDDQVSWTYSDTREGLNFYRRLRSGIDASNNVYQTYYDNSTDGIKLLKLNENGELCWSTAVTGDSYSYASYVNLVMDVEDESANLIFSGNSDGCYSFFRQTYNSDGNVEFEGDDTILHQGWSNSFSSLTYAEGSDPQEELVFTWINRYENKLYRQDIDTSGESNRTPLVSFSEGIELMSVIDNDGFFYVLWVDTDSNNRVFVNLFDQDGNRQWSEDICFGVNFDPGSIKAVVHDNQLLFYGHRLACSWRWDVITQSIVDGELAWEEPLVLAESEIGYNSYAINDYVFFVKDNSFRALRLDENGEPCEGWDAEGNEFSSSYSLVVDPIVTDEGVAIISQDSGNILFQIVRPNGTMVYENAVTLTEDMQTIARIVKLVDGVVYLFYIVNNDLICKAVDIEGNSVWDSELTVATGIDNYGDIESVEDGFLVTYTYYNSQDYHSFLHLQHIDFHGELWDEPEVLRDDRGGCSQANIAPATDNRYIITWYDCRDIRGITNMYAQLYRYEPLSTDDPTDIPAWEPDMKVYPNPFNPETTVRFSLPTDSNVDLKVYNVKGQLVRTLCDDLLPLGNHEITWDGTDNAKKCVSSGVYLFNLKINGKDYRSKALLLK